MSTNNFYNHENGIFTIPALTYEQAKEWLLSEDNDNRKTEKEITDKQIYDEIYVQLSLDCEFFFENFADYLAEKGYMLDQKDAYTAVVYNKQKKLVAELELRSGYYDGVQVIAETEPCKLERYLYLDEPLYTQYTPNHKRLIKYVKEWTTPIIKVAQSDNGAAFYQYVQQ